MLLRRLKLENFRNYLEFDQGFNQLKTIIIGQNAQGKSNILEAINLLASSESQRATRDSDLIYWNKSYALIFADIEKKEDNLQIALQINTTGRRKLKINNVFKKAPQADLIGNFFCVMFSADDLYLIKGSPSIRRGWLDSVLFQLEHKYHRLHLNYSKAVTQKNALLKKAHEISIPKKDLYEQVEIWNEQIINYGSEILSLRLDFLKEIEPVARKFLGNISSHTEDLQIEYKSSLGQESFKAALKKSMEEEIARGQSVIGPHRDDLIFSINKKETKSFASQGQQRSNVLAIKLAEVKIIEKQKKEVPVLLLDDVLAELDEPRQDFLLHNMPENIQTFLTTTHISDIQKEFLKGGEVLKVENGKVFT